jgi:hypothetical protein
MSQSSAAKAAPSPEARNPNLQREPTNDDIRQRAYEIYISRANGPGDEVQDWLQAESELRSKIS